jgi:hypothetical protein
MKRNIALLALGMGLAVVLALQAEPTPTPSRRPIRVPARKITPSPKLSPIHVPGKNPTPHPKSSPIHVPGKNTSTPVSTVAPIKVPGKNNATPTPTMAPIHIPGKNGPTPTPTTAAVKIPGKNGPSPTPTSAPIKIPGKNTGTPTPTPKILIPGKKITPTPGPPKNDNKKDVHVWINIDLIPPPPSQLGPPLYIPHVPVYHSVPQSQTNHVVGGVAPIPESYTPPAENAPVQVSPTALRAWNGQPEPPGRAFDQTRVQLAAGEDGALSWQFYWKTAGPPAQAARWEVTTVPFAEGATTFPPAGLVGYGDASVNATAPLSENFFALDFNSFAKNFEQGAVPKKYYMRVVVVDAEGNAVGAPSNLVRIDLP